jgi:hypothetical protein
VAREQTNRSESSHLSAMVARYSKSQTLQDRVRQSSAVITPYELVPARLPKNIGSIFVTPIFGLLGIPIGQIKGLWTVYRRTVALSRNSGFQIR